MFRTLLFSITVAWLFLSSPAWGGQLVRVLLSAAAQQISASAPGGIVAMIGREEMTFLTPVTIVPATGGMLLDGLWWPVERVTLRARNEDLSVVFSEQGLSPEGGVAENPSLSKPNGRPTQTSTLMLPGRVQLLLRGKTFEVINELDLETYVAGVVPWEMNAAWHPEALKAQAVAARTYALYQQQANAGREYDLVSTTQDQVYRGRSNDPRIQYAVEATRGLVLMHDKTPILAAFFSTAAGPTEDAFTVWAKDLPYLKGVDCPFDANSPYFRWRATFKLEDLEAGLRRQGISIGTIANLTALTHSRAGRVVRLRVLHSGGELILRGEELRRAIGYTVIPSTLFEVELVGRQAVLSGRGAGHAVGLCQWGAKELAVLGYTFSTILHYYFPGTDLVDIRPK
jgi:stage II sporulation protein D